MTEEYFYHYTDMEAAQEILLAGNILPSLVDNGDAAHGDGVYLTTLEPRLGKETIKNNNWAGMAGSMDKKLDVYFEIFIPSRKVWRAKERRDIQVHTGALHLPDYKWSLKNWVGELLATQHFMVSSHGEAVMYQGNVMGRYTLVHNIVMHDNIPVYKHDEKDFYLYTIKSGDWCVGSVAGSTKTFLHQPSGGSFPPSPPKTVTWKFYNRTSWQEDVSLKVFPCY